MLATIEIPLTQSAIDRFNSYVAKTNNDDECWLFTKKIKKGYGQFHISGNTYGAHRVAYTIANGPVPAGLMVRHACNNPSCCNPKHLSTGTQQDNMRDMRIHNRQPKKIQTKEAARLVLTYKRGVSHGWFREMAKLHKVSKRTIERIAKGKRRQHVLKDALDMSVVPNNSGVTQVAG